jgi:hypothetical protein
MVTTKDIFSTHPSLKNKHIIISHHFTGKTSAGQTVKLSSEVSESFIFLPDTIKKETVDRLLFDNLQQMCSEYKETIRKLENEVKTMQTIHNQEELKTAAENADMQNNYEYIELNDEQKKHVMANIREIELKIHSNKTKNIKCEIAMKGITDELRSKIKTQEMVLEELKYDLENEVSMTTMKKDIYDQNAEIERLEHNKNALMEQLKKGLKRPKIEEKPKLGEEEPKNEKGD